MDCLTEERALAFVQGKVRPPASVKIEAHLNRCSACRRLAAHAANAVFEDSPPAANFDLHASITFLPGTAAPHSSGILLPGTQVGRYQIVDLIGAGATATVYRAYDPRLHRHIALKLIHATYSSAATVDEAEAMARLSHPHVVGVHDAGMIDEHVFVVMELIEGTTLSAWLRHGQRSWRDVLSVFLDAGSGLAAAHAVNLVHGDFKPDNILVDADGRAKVTDFGLAVTPTPVPDGKASSAPAPVQLSGTPAYMAPEQFLGQPSNHLADQFSYSVSLYSSLYGTHPFFPRHSPPGTVQQFMNTITSGQIAGPPPNTEAPPWLLPIIARGLERRPEDRFASMHDLIAEIHRHLAAPRAGPVPARRWATAAVIIAAVVAAAGAMLWKFSNERHPALVTAVCGNGIVEAGEQCDDGNRSDNDACLSTCKFATCGDGRVRTGVEECDDGNQRDGDECSAYCLRCAGGDARVSLAQNGHCYMRYDKPQTWKAASATCRSTGSHLITFGSAFEMTAAERDLIQRSGTMYWIGFHDPSGTNNYVWTTGEATHYFAAWLASTSQPKGGCVAIQQRPGGWAAMSCDLSWGFICEKDNWILHPENNHAYRAFGQEKTWDGARNLCQRMGTHLLTISDAQESAFVHARFPFTRWAGAIKTSAATGFQWITGEPFSPSLFGQGDPDLQIVPACVVLTEDLWLRDRSCDETDNRGPYGVICESE